MKTPTLEIEEVKIRRMKALKRELGAAGMAQFIQQFAKGRGDYSQDRHRILDRFSVEELFASATRKNPHR